jgi:hypothetical protein
MFHCFAVITQALLVAAAWILQSCSGLDNGRGLTPAMGFNTWNKFSCMLQGNPITENPLIQHF